jgi:hypothetical protein
MKKTLAEVISRFGADAKAKLSNSSVTGEPEDQLLPKARQPAKFRQSVKVLNASHDGGRLPQPKADGNISFIHRNANTLPSSSRSPLAR